MITIPLKSYNYLVLVLLLTLYSCQRNSVGSYNLDSILNDDIIEKYQRNILTNQFKKEKSDIDSLKGLLSAHRDSLKNNLISKSGSFESYNNIKKDLLNKQRDLRAQQNETGFNIQDSIYQKVSLAVKLVGEREGLDIILPQNKYSLNYIASKVEVTDKMKQELKKLMK